MAGNGSVYVCNLPEGTDESMLAEYFGTIGLLKKDKRTGRPKIWLYRDKETNEPKGDATVTYEDPHAAAAAVEWFNNKDFHGSVIGVFIADMKNKDAVDAVNVPVVELEEPATDVNGGAGRGRGRGDASGKPWKQEGDWLCPNTSARPAGAFGGGSGAGGRGKGRGAPDSGAGGRGAGAGTGAGAAGASTGLFGPNDWPCPMCGNINWAKRLKCNICNTNKPGHNEGGVRGGRAGGYKELDEEEIEETRRRRKEAEADDEEMYDEFGNLKKKYRAKTQQVESARGVPGAGRAGWEVEDLGVGEKEGRERSRDRGRERDDRSSRNRDRDDRERRRSRSRERGDRARDHHDRDRDHGRDRDRDRERSSSKYRY